MDDLGYVFRQKIDHYLEDADQPVSYVKLQNRY
jgi:hypothetical protein